MSRLDLVTLLVADLPRSVHFYRDLLGLEVVKDAGGYVELASGGSRLALFPAADLGKLLETPTAPAAGSVVVSFEVDDLDSRFAAFAARGAEAVWAPATAPWGKRVGFLRDPDGNLVELYGGPASARL